MNKLYKDISRMIGMINIINQYNNFRQLGTKDEIDYLKEKIDNLYNIKDTQELIKEFKYCADMCNMFYNEIDSEFKTRILSEEKSEEINNI